MQSLTSGESTTNQINGDNELLTFAVAFAGLTYQAVTKQGETPLSLFKDDICEILIKNALVGADSIEFPRFHQFGVKILWKRSLGTPQ